MTSTTIAEPWDAVVIGAGPAGSVAARELARRNVRTLLVDKATFPRAKVCGGCLNGNALATLERIGLGPVARRAGGADIDRLVLAAGGRRATVALPHGFAVSRSAFDAALIDEALDAGVTFRPGLTARIGDGETETRSVVLVSAAGTTVVAAKVVVVADGLNGRAGSERLASPSSRIGAGVVFADAPEEYRPGRIHMATAAGGYVGLVRVERDQLDVAAAFDSAFVRQSGSLGLAAKSILRDAGFPEIPDLSDAGWKGTPTLTRRPARVGGPRWFAVGDAAGYVEPFTGEGMAWAIGGAVAVAAIAARGVNEWSEGLTAEWTRTHARLVGRRQWSCRVLSRLLRSPRACRWLVAGLSLAPGIAGPFVRGLNRPSRRAGGFP